MLPIDSARSIRWTGISGRLLSAGVGNGSLDEPSIRASCAPNGGRQFTSSGPDPGEHPQQRKVVYRFEQPPISKPLGGVDECLAANRVDGLVDGAGHRAATGKLKDLCEIAGVKFDS